MGTYVRMRSFTGTSFQGDWTNTHFSPGEPDVSNVDRLHNALSIRVEDATRDFWCSDLRIGEFALYSGPNYTGDCVVYKYPPLNSSAVYQDSAHMGIANDTINSASGGPSYGPTPPQCTQGSLPVQQDANIVLYSDNNLGGTWAQLSNGYGYPDFGGFANQVSSFYVYNNCNIFIP